MNAENMPIANQNYVNQEDCSKQRNKGDLSSQHSNHGIGHNSGGVIKDNAKVAGKFEENNIQQSQKIDNQVTVNINPQNNLSISQKEDAQLSKRENIKVSILEDLILLIRLYIL
jgi:hypothetical protein